MHRTLLVFVDDIYEGLELCHPMLRLEEAGYTTRLAGPALLIADKMILLLPV